MAIATMISTGEIASKAARNGTTNGADAGMNVATRATMPDGSLITAKIATKSLTIAIIVTGVDAVDASSSREARAPRKPSAVEYSAYPRTNQSVNMRIAPG